MSERPTDWLPSCREVFDHLPEWAEGELPEPDAAPYARHLELCPPCGHAARQYQALARLARGALETRMPDDARERLRRALDARLRGR